MRGPDKKPRQQKPSTRDSLKATEETTNLDVGYSAPDSVRQLKRKAAHQLPEGPIPLYKQKRPPPVPLTRSRLAGKK